MELPLPLYSPTLTMNVGDCCASAMRIRNHESIKEQHITLGGVATTSILSGSTFFSLEVLVGGWWGIRAEFYVAGTSIQGAILSSRARNTQLGHKSILNAETDGWYRSVLFSAIPTFRTLAFHLTYKYSAVHPVYQRPPCTWIRRTVVERRCWVRESDLDSNPEICNGSVFVLEVECWFRDMYLQDGRWTYWGSLGYARACLPCMQPWPQVTCGTPDTLFRQITTAIQAIE